MEQGATPTTAYTSWMLQVDQALAYEALRRLPEVQLARIGEEIEAMTVALVRRFLDGAPPVAEPTPDECVRLNALLDRIDRREARGLTDIIANVDPAFLDQLRRARWGFEQLTSFPRWVMERIIREVGAFEMMLALVGTQEGVRGHVLAGMSQRAAQRAAEDVAVLVRVEDLPERVRQARELVQSTVLRLLEREEIAPIVPDAQLA